MVLQLNPNQLLIKFGWIPLLYDLQVSVWLIALSYLPCNSSCTFSQVLKQNKHKNDLFLLYP